MYFLYDGGTAWAHHNPKVGAFEGSNIYRPEFKLTHGPWPDLTYIRWCRLSKLLRFPILLACRMAHLYSHPLLVKETPTSGGWCGTIIDFPQPSLGRNGPLWSIPNCLVLFFFCWYVFDASLLSILLNIKAADHQDLTTLNILSGPAYYCVWWLIFGSLLVTSRSSGVNDPRWADDNNTFAPHK